MKKLLIGLTLLLLIIFGVIFFYPNILFAFPFTQKLALKLEDEQAAEFYFKNEQKDSLYMKGVIYSGSYDDLTKKLNNNPTVTTLIM